MMTLNQAFKDWSAVPEHKIHAAATRMSVQKVLLAQYGDIDVTLIDKHYVTMIIKDCKVDHRQVVNAISVLCHILTWLHDSDAKVYPMPDFDYNITSIGREPAKTSTKKSALRVSPVQQVPAAPAVESAPTPEKEDNKQDTSMKKGQRVKRDDAYLRRPVVQIDKETHQEIARFDTASSAEKSLGIKNVLRAIDRCGSAGGFYWAFADEFTEGWKPEKRPRDYRRVVPEAVIAQKKTITKQKKTASSKQREFLKGIPDAILLEEMRRRENWHGSVTITTTVTETF